MPAVDSRAGRPGQPAPDVLVIGAGVMGLWAALMAARQGLSVVLVERDRIGAGASGGLLGALMPHLPDRWNAKKQFQLQSLVSLQSEIAALEAETGRSAGYRRTGRLIPLVAGHHRERALRHSQDAAAVWNLDGRTFSFDVVDAAPTRDWPAPEAMPSGLVFDNLAARISPRGLVGLLRGAIEQMTEVRIVEGAEVIAIDPVAQSVRLGSGESIGFGHLILAAGVRSFDLFAEHGPALDRPIGTAVKGQAALFKADIDPALPVLFSDGTYIVPHEGGYCAVGSTSEDSFDDPGSTDHLLDEAIAKAVQLAPVLQSATVIERWAGLRPKAIGRDPLAGRHPEHNAVSLLTGGFKISFGIAHELARAVVGQIEGGSPIGLPPSFTVEAHLEAARRDKS